MCGGGGGEGAHRYARCIVAAFVQCVVSIGEDEVIQQGPHYFSPLSLVSPS